jgi:hypothetical protein
MALYTLIKLQGGAEFMVAETYRSVTEYVQQGTPFQATSVYLRSSGELTPTTHPNFKKVLIRPEFVAALVEYEPS